MAESERPRDVFRFFDLPLEMREAIYDESVENHEGKLNESGLTYKASNVPLLSLLLVSKRVNQEYSNRLRNKQSLVIEDDFKPISSDEFELPAPATLFHYMTLDIVMYRDTWDEEVETHESWLVKLLREAPKKLHFNIRTVTSPADREPTEAFCKSLIERSGANTTIVVQKATFYDKKGVTYVRHDATPQLKWSHEKQKLEDISGGDVLKLGVLSLED